MILIIEPILSFQIEFFWQTTNELDEFKHTNLRNSRKYWTKLYTLVYSLQPMACEQILLTCAIRQNERFSMITRTDL